MNNHNLKINPIIYPNGLRLIECHACEYAFFAESDDDIIKFNTKEIINHGDVSAAHTLFQIPDIYLELDVKSDTNIL